MKKLVWMVALLFFATPVFSAEKDDIKLMIPKYQATKEGAGNTWRGMPEFSQFSKPSGEKMSTYIEKGLKEFVQMFEKSDYKVNQIELWIEGSAEGGNKLFISLEGKGGCKITLTPKKP